MTATTYNGVGISQRTNVYAERQMLKHAGPVRVLDKFALVKPMPKNKSQTVKFRRPKTFTAQTTPLVEGVTPSSTQFMYEDVSVSLKQYGQVVEITDHIADTLEDPVLNDATLQCGENIGRTMESLDWGVLRAGTNVYYANGTARESVNTPISLNKLRAAVRFAKAQKAMMHTNILDGSPNFQTKPIEASYIAVCHTDMESDIRNLAGFTPVAEYGSRRPCCEYEFGSVENVRFVCSPDLTSIADAGDAYAGSGTNMVTTSGTNADIYPVLLFGKEAYGSVPLRGQGSVEPTIIPVGQKTKDDPLGQRGYVGWKSWHATLILNQAWMVRIECAVTDL